MKRALVHLFLLLFLAVPSTGALSQPVSLAGDQVIGETLRIDGLSGADDLLRELEHLAQAYVDDPAADDPAIGVNLTKSTATVTHFHGSEVSTLAMVLPLLPGSVGDAGTAQGRLALRLRAEVTDKLLNEDYWDWEYAGGTGSPYLPYENPSISVQWHHRWSTGPHWEKMHALWAYAYYTGDWALIQANWSFIKGKYLEGYRTPGPEQRAFAKKPEVFRNAANDLANGLIAYTRMAERLGDATAPTARAEARAALQEVLERLDVSWDNCPVTRGWDNGEVSMSAEWTPGYNLTPELGRWIYDQAFATARNRLDEAANAGELQGHWWAGYFNNMWTGRVALDEDMWGMPALSHQLFLGRAWMLWEDASLLREAKPWPVTMGRTPLYRDMLYVRSLYALITRHATLSWVPANP